MVKKTINAWVKKSSLLTSIKLLYSKRKWRKKNIHNSTKAKNPFNHTSVSVGKGTYGDLDVRHFGNSDEELRIGNYCSIGPDCVFILGGGHEMNHVSTYPFRFFSGMSANESTVKGPIIIDDDVWIGFGSTILSGVHIEQGAVIAARALVNKDVPPYAIVGGVPAKIIGYRFPQSIIDYLLTLDYGSLTEELIDTHIKELYMTIQDDIETVCGQLEWFPKKE